jgi:hypothetical protein
MTAGERILALLDHRRVDPESDAILEALAGALGEPFERVALVAYGDEEAGIPAGRVLDDPAVAPDWALPHAGLYTGGTMPPRLDGESETDYLARARDALVYPHGIRRGTHAAIKLAGAPFLTGTKSIAVLDDVGGPYDLTVRTRTSETPDPAAFRRAIEGSIVSGGAKGAIRAELVLLHVVSEDPLINEIHRSIDLITEPIDAMTAAGTS